MSRTDLASAAVTFFLGELVDALVVLAVVLNTVIGFVQEYRAGKEIEVLASSASYTCCS